MRRTRRKPGSSSCAATGSRNSTSSPPSASNLRGNIYLAKVTRVEPSLQAAFVDYGGNRHGFLAFSEIHPDYYQIPVADRQALIDEESRAHRAAEEEEDHRGGRRRRQRGRGRGADRSREVRRSQALPADEAAQALEAEEQARDAAEIPAGEAALGQDRPAMQSAAPEAGDESGNMPASGEDPAAHRDDDRSHGAYSDAASDEPIAAETTQEEPPLPETESESISGAEHGNGPTENGEDGNGEDAESARMPMARTPTATTPMARKSASSRSAAPTRWKRCRTALPRPRRQYKIQEVIKRRQVMLVQVVKEERGNKGAALTTYLSLAGRYSVLMPNTARGGGISRKITNAEDRKRLKEIAAANSKCRRAWASSCAPPARTAPSSRSSATSNICCGCGRPCAT